MATKGMFIRSAIDARVKAKETTYAYFYISTPKTTNDGGLDRENPALKEVKAILNKYGALYYTVDNVPGAWNLNREWLETGIMECAVEYTGVYPVNWYLADILRLEEMSNNGELIINAMIKNCNRWEPNL